MTTKIRVKSSAAMGPLPSGKWKHRYTATTVQEGGTGPFTYAWSGPGTVLDNTQNDNVFAFEIETDSSASYVPIGTVSVVVTDSEGCTATDSTNVVTPDGSSGSGTSGSSEESSESSETGGGGGSSSDSSGIGGGTSSSDTANTSSSRSSNSDNGISSESGSQSSSSENGNPPSSSLSSTSPHPESSSSSSYTSASPESSSSSTLPESSSSSSSPTSPESSSSSSSSTSPVSSSSSSSSPSAQSSSSSFSSSSGPCSEPGTPPAPGVVFTACDTVQILEVDPLPTCTDSLRLIMSTPASNGAFNADEPQSNLAPGEYCAQWEAILYGRDSEGNIDTSVIKAAKTGDSTCFTVRDDLIVQITALVNEGGPYQDPVPAPGSFTFIATASNGTPGYVYTWSDTTQGDTLNKTYEEPGTYTETVTVQDSRMCEATASVSVVVAGSGTSSSSSSSSDSSSSDSSSSNSSSSSSSSPTNPESSSSSSTSPESSSSSSSSVEPQSSSSGSYFPPPSCCITAVAGAPQDSIAEVCGIQASDSTQGTLVIYLANIPVSTVGWDFSTLNDEDSPATIRVPASAAAGRHSLIYTYKGTQGPKIGVAKSYCVDVLAESSSSSSGSSGSSSSGSSSSSGGNCAGISVMSEACQRVRVKLERPLHAPPGNLHFVFFVLRQDDFNAHQWGSILAPASLPTFTPVGTKQMEFIAQELMAPRRDKNHSYKLFAEYYTPQGGYIGASCPLSYTFNEQLCVEATPTNHADQCGTGVNVGQSCRKTSAGPTP